MPVVDAVSLLRRAIWRGIIVLVISACGLVVPHTPTPIPYSPPPLPGSVEIVDGTVYVEPDMSTDYFPNPGMGWQNEIETPESVALQESVVYANRREIAWSILNPAPGVYDWPILDEMLQKAIAADKQFSFRIYTMVGESYSGHMVPEWVLAKGATLLLETGEPDYSNCIYQEEWGEFINELVRVYDGNPNIAFVDISGYGNFNEWSWQNNQTEWDLAWEAGYLNGLPESALFETVDGQARRRLADIFIGGSFHSHQCYLANGQIATVEYSYPGFKKTQLVMPYAGIIQSSQYVNSRRKDVGFRYDCLGRNSKGIQEKAGNLIAEIWRSAPVVFEFCKPHLFNLDDAKTLLYVGHGSLVHDNSWRFSLDLLQELVMKVGYRYYLKDATMKMEGQVIDVQMNWQNLGYAPSYPKMGQEFQLYFYLIDTTGAIIHAEAIPADISQWSPLDLSSDSPPVYSIAHVVRLPFLPEKGVYYTGVAIVETRTGEPINLAFGGKDLSGWHLLAPISIK